MRKLVFVAEEGGALLPKNWSPENTDLLEAEGDQYTISQFQLHLCNDIITVQFEI